MGWICEYERFDGSFPEWMEQNEDWFLPKNHAYVGKPHFAAASCGTGGNTVCYRAVRNLETGETWALIILLRKEDGAVCYKDMDETMGPAESECPNRILDLLTPTEHEYAQEWRARCRRHNARIAAARSLKDGVKIRFAEPVRFSCGSADTFTVRKVGGKVRFSAWFESAGATLLCRITNWRRMDWEIVGAPAVTAAVQPALF